MAIAAYCYAIMPLGAEEKKKREIDTGSTAAAFTPAMPAS